MRVVGVGANCPIWIAASSSHRWRIRRTAADLGDIDGIVSLTALLSLMRILHSGRDQALTWPLLADAAASLFAARNWDSNGETLDARWRMRRLEWDPCG